MKKIIPLLFLSIFANTCLNAQDSIPRNQNLSIKRHYDQPNKYYLGRNQISYDSFLTVLSASGKSTEEIRKTIKFRNRANKLYAPLAILIIPTAALGLASKLNGYKKSWYNTTFVSLSIPVFPLLFYTLSISKKSQRHFKKAIQLYNVP